MEAGQGHDLIEAGRGRARGRPLGESSTFTHRPGCPTATCSRSGKPPPAGQRRSLLHLGFASPNMAVYENQAAPLRGAGSGAPRAGLSLGEARPARPRRPFRSTPQIRQAYSASAVANVARRPLVQQLCGRSTSRPKPWSQALHRTEARAGVVEPMQPDAFSEHAGRAFDSLMRGPAAGSGRSGTGA